MAEDGTRSRVSGQKVGHAYGGTSGNNPNGSGGFDGGGSTGLGETGNADEAAYINQAQSPSNSDDDFQTGHATMPGKRQSSSVEQQPPSASRTFFQKIQKSSFDVLKNETEKCQDKSGNSNVLGESKVQNETGQNQQIPTVGQSQVQNETLNCEQNITRDTEVVEHSKLQNEMGKHNLMGNYSLEISPCNDSKRQSSNMDSKQTMLIKTESSEEEQTQADNKIHSHKIKFSSVDMLLNLEMRCIIEGKLQEAELKCQWQVKPQGNDYYLQILSSDNHIVVRDFILQVVEQFQSKVCKAEVTEVRLYMDNDRLMYILEHQTELLKNISESCDVQINVENSDEFVIAGERENAIQAERELMVKCKGIHCKTDFNTNFDLDRPGIVAKLRDLEGSEKCIIGFPGVYHKTPRCLYSWMYHYPSALTFTIICGPVESSTADVIVLPVNARGDIIGDSDGVSQVHVDRSQIKSKFVKEKILFLPNSTTLDCLTIALAFIPEWTNEGQIDDGELKKFDKLLKYAIERGIRSMVIPVDITEGFPFTSFGEKLTSRLAGEHTNLVHRLEIFMCTKTVNSAHLLKSKLKSTVFQRDQGDSMTEVLFGIERQLEISRDMKPGDTIQIHVKSESMVSMQSKVDVIVNSVGIKLDLSEYDLSRQLLNAAGASVQYESTQEYPKGLLYGCVAVTGPGRLRCKMLCHGTILRQWMPSENFSIRVLKSVLRKCLVETERRQYKTIAMPAVWTGTLCYPYHRVAEAMFDVVTEYQRDHQNTCITDVFFVIHQDDKKALQAFKVQEERKIKRSKKLYTATVDHSVEYMESCCPELRLRFQFFLLANAQLMMDKPDAVVSFECSRNTDSVSNKWCIDGNYLDITAHYDGTDDTFKRRIEEILKITEENMITCVAFHLHLSSFVTKSPVALAEYARRIIYERTYAETSVLNLSGKRVDHYIRQIQFVVYSNTDIRSYIPRKTKGYSKNWHFVSCTKKGNRVFRVIAGDETTVKAVQDKVRKLVMEEQQVQMREQDQGYMREEGLSVSLTEEDYNAFLFFAASTSWFRAVESSVKWEAGTLCINPITDKYKQKVSQLLKEIKEMNTLDFPLRDAELEKASDKCFELQKEFQDVYLSCELKDRNIITRSNIYESNVKVKYKLELSFGRIKLPGRNDMHNNATNTNEGEHLNENEDGDDTSSTNSSNLGENDRVDVNVQVAGATVSGYRTLDSCLEEVDHNGGEYRTKEGILVKIYSGSITNLPVDCIVNAANEQLAHGGGVAYAISRAAGYDFDRESREYVQKYGQLRIAECCSTTAGDLSYKCAIHTVGPRWHDYRDKTKCLGDLQKSVEVTFEEAAKLQLSSIAVPPISSGIFSVPKTDCAEQYYRAIVSYSHKHGQTSSLKEIHIVDVGMIDFIQKTFTRIIREYDHTAA